MKSTLTRPLVLLQVLPQNLREAAGMFGRTRHYIVRRVVVRQERQWGEDEGRVDYIEKRFEPKGCPLSDYDEAVRTGYYSTPIQSGDTGPI